MNTSPKPRKCAVCPKEFTPARMGQEVCSPLCAMRKVRAAKASERAETRARRESAKPRAKWLAECQAIVNKYARLRDWDKSCVSCDRPAEWDGQWHGSHFRSVGAASAVRFCLWNIHKACSICNNHKSGNLEGYRPRILDRIGAERVDWLLAQNQLVRYEVPYLRKFKRVMGKRLRRLEKRLERREQP